MSEEYGKRPYITCMADDLGLLEKIVCVNMRDGYQPAGGIVVRDGMFIQALYKPQHLPDMRLM